MHSFPDPVRRAGRSQAAFTLIELLVVIAIIAILAAILFPVFAQARDKARQTMCLSNGKQIGMALSMYTQDFDERLPRVWTGGPPARDWTLDLLPYIKTGNPATDSQRINAALASTRPDLFAASQPFFQCPSKGPSRDSRGFRRGYGYNYWLAQDTPVSLGTLSAPADMLAFGEVWGEVDRLIPFNPPSGVDTRFIPEARHSNGLNLVFCDGHAKWVNGTDSKMYWPKGLVWDKQPVGTYFWPS